MKSNPKIPRKLTASPRSFPLFRTIARAKKPSRAEIDSALLVCETLLARQIPSDSPTLWDFLAALRLPPSQESWLRALFMDLAGASPYVSDPRQREARFRAYLSKIRKELRILANETSLRTSTSPFSKLEELFSDV